MSKINFNKAASDFLHRMSGRNAEFEPVICKGFPRGN